MQMGVREPHRQSETLLHSRVSACCPHAVCGLQAGAGERGGLARGRGAGLFGVWEIGGLPSPPQSLSAPPQTVRLPLQRRLRPLCTGRLLLPNRLPPVADRSCLRLSPSPHAPRFLQRGPAVMPRGSACGVGGTPGIAWHCRAAPPGRHGTA